MTLCVFSVTGEKPRERLLWKDVSFSLGKWWQTESERREICWSIERKKRWRREGGGLNYRKYRGSNSCCVSPSLFHRLLASAEQLTKSVVQLMQWPQPKGVDALAGITLVTVGRLNWFMNKEGPLLSCVGNITPIYKCWVIRLCKEVKIHASVFDWKSIMWVIYFNMFPCAFY